MTGKHKENKNIHNIEFGKSTGKLGVEVNERLERAVKECFKSQVAPVEQIHSNISEETIRESIIVRVLDQYLPLLPDKEAFEVSIHREISDDVWEILTRTDGKYIPAEGLKKICREHGISIGKRDKKELALELYDRGIILV